MAYQLKENESLIEGLRRVGQEEQQETLEALTSDNPHKGVHEARKHLKKLRALIRLVRDELGHEQYKKRNNFFRDIGRHCKDQSIPKNDRAGAQRRRKNTGQFKTSVQKGIQGLSPRLE